MDALSEYLVKIEDFPTLLKTLLQEKFVDKIIGAEIRVDKKTNEVDRFTINPKIYEKPADISEFPLTNLIAYGYARTDSAAKFLHESVQGAMKERVGLIARPCDTRALIELAKIRQVNLNNLFVIAFEDRGIVFGAGREVKKFKDIKPADIVKEKIGDNGLIFKFKDGSTKEIELNVTENCTRCFRKIPIVADISISDLGLPIDSDEIILKTYSDKGNELVEKSKINKKNLPTNIKTEHLEKIQEIKENAIAKRVKDLEDWEKVPQEEKIARLQKCTACGICIRGCPVCYCVDCILLKKKKSKIIDNISYLLTRIAHDADRCVECGRCDDNCPQHLPLSLYFQSLNEAFKERFKYVAGENVNDVPFRSGKAIKAMELEKV